MRLNVFGRHRAHETRTHKKEVLTARERTLTFTLHKKILAEIKRHDVLAVADVKRLAD